MTAAGRTLITAIWPVTYDLKAGNELQFEDLFKPDSATTRQRSQSFLVADIDKRATALEQEIATQPQTPTKRDEPIVSADQLSEPSGSGLSPKGLVIYFDFPHVIAAFDKNLVPYSVVKEYLKPNGPAARFQ